MFKRMKAYFENEFRPFKEICNEIGDDSPMHQYFLDRYETIRYKKSGDGYILVCCAYNWWRVMVVGQVNKEDLMINGACVYYKPSNDDWRNLEDLGCADFVIDWDKNKTKKYCQKHSVSRRIREGIDIKSGYDVHITRQEWECLFSRWSSLTNTQRTNGKRGALNSDGSKVVSNHYDFLNRHLFKIAYYRNGVLACLQMFRFVGSSVYWVLNTSDYNMIEYVQIAYPCMLIGKPLHFLGAGPNDRRLLEYKSKLTDKVIVHRTLTIKSVNESTDLLHTAYDATDRLNEGFRRVCEFYGM